MAGTSGATHSITARPKATNASAAAERENEDDRGVRPHRLEVEEIEEVRGRRSEECDQREEEEPRPDAANEPHRLNPDTRGAGRIGAP